MTAAALELSTRRRLAMVACGYVPFLTSAVTLTPAALAVLGVWPAWTTWLGVAFLLVVPPMIVRLALALRPLPAGEIELSDAAFLVWWFTSQWQVVFNRLPWIEEMIRLVPGLYAAWLRLWGARVGRFVYWTPGLRVLDRSLVSIGDRVVFGVGVRINPHVLGLSDGRTVLRVKTVKIGSDALVGGYSVLTSGAWVGDGEVSPPKIDFRPDTGWQHGRRVRATEGRRD